MKNLRYPLAIICIGLVIVSCNYAEKQREAAEKARRERENPSVKKNYSKNGRLLSEVPLKDGKYHGVGKNYYKTGKVQSTITYSEGRKHGKTLWYYESGEVYRESIFVEGKLDGIRKLFYKSSALKAEIPYVDGELQTGTKDYKEDGKLISNQPRIIFDLDNNLILDGTATLKIYISTKTTKVEYFQDGKTASGEVFRVPYLHENGVITRSFFVPRGSFVMEKITIYAKVKSKLGNDMLLKETYNLALEH